MKTINNLLFIFALLYSGDLFAEDLNVNGIISLNSQKFLQLSNGNTFYVGDLAGGDGKVGTLHLRTNDQNRFTIDSNGKVGIGTTSPEAALHIKSDTTPLIFYRSGGGGSGVLTIDNKMNGSGADMVYTPSAESGTTVGGHAFYVDNGSNVFEMGIDHNGNVGIGTTNPGNFKLAVEGIIGARELKVTEDSWSDFVFKDNYPLKSLKEVESFIQQNKHLPGIPSEKEVLANGVSVGDIQKRLLQKVEELTLHVIEQNPYQAVFEGKTLKITLQKN